MNKGKVGRPYQYSNAEIFAAYAIICNKMYTFSKQRNEGKGVDVKGAGL